jgi:mannosyltransferase
MSDAWLRLLSALLGIASLPIMYRVASRVGGSPVALGATALLALSPYHVYFSREARSYTLLFLLCLVSLDLLLDLGAAPDGKKWIAFAAVNAGIALTHYMGVLFIAGEVLTAWMLRGQRPAFLKEFMLASAGAFVLYLPWLFTFMAHATKVSARFWLPVPTLRMFWSSMSALVVGPFSTGTLPHVVAASFYALAMGAVRGRRELALLPLLVVPPVGELLVSLHRPLFYSRTFQYILIPLFILVAAALGRLSRAGCAAAIALLCIALIPGLVKIETTRAKEDWRAAAAWIDASVGEDELVVVQPGFLGLGLERYAGSSRWMDRVRLVDADDLLRQGTPRPAVREELRTRARGVWLIFRYGDDQGWLESLAPEFQRAASSSFRGVDVHHFRRK